MRAFLHRSRPDLVLVVVLIFLALALRVPYLMSAPMITDEFVEINRALDVAENGEFVLVEPASYIGPFWLYYIAGLTNMFGHHLWLPRVSVMLIGVLTVIVTYFFAKELTRGDRRVGVLAALALACNPQHIFYNSHVAWSNHATPFFTTLAMLVYVYATRRARPWWLLVASALFALAAQTHPLALVLVPAFLVDFCFSARTRALLRTAIPYLAVASALVIYSPVLVYNFSTDLNSFRDAALRDYAFQPSLDPPELVLRAFEMDRRLGYIAFGFLNQPVARDPNHVWIALAFFLLTASCLVWFARRERFPLVIVALGALGMLLVNQNYNALLRGRYLVYLLPLIFTVWSAAGVALWDAVSQRWRQNREHRFVMWGTRGIVGLACAALLLLPLVRLYETYQALDASRLTEDAWLAMVEHGADHPAVPIQMTSDLTKTRVGKILLYYFRLAQRPIQVVPESSKQIDALATRLKTMPRGMLIAPDSLRREIGIPMQARLTAPNRCIEKCGRDVPISLLEWGALP